MPALYEPADSELPTVWVDRGDLAAATSVAAMAVPASLLDDGIAYQGTWLTVTKDGLEVATRGPDLSVRSHVALLPDPAGQPAGPTNSMDPSGAAVIAPARLLARLVLRVEPGPVALGLGPDGLVIRSGRFRGRYRDLDTTGLHPPQPSSEPVWEVTLAGEVFRDAVQHLSAAIGRVVTGADRSGGLLIVPTGETMVDLAVTDRSDLAVAACPAEFPSRSDRVTPVSTSARVVSVLRALRSTSEPVTVSCWSDRVTFTVGATSVTARRFLGEVPDHRTLTRIEPTHWMSVSQRNLATAMRRVSVLAHDHHHAVWFELTRDHAVVRASQEEIGQVSDRIPVRYTGSHCEIGLGLHRLADMIDRLPDGRVRIEFAERNKVARLRSEDRADLVFCTRLLAVRHRPWHHTEAQRGVEAPTRLLPLSPEVDTGTERGPGQ